MPDRPRFSRFRRLPGLFRTGDARPPDPREEPVPLTVYLPSRLLDLAENLAARHGSANIQEYCEGLLTMAIEEEEIHAREQAIQVTQGTFESLDEFANDPEYLTALTASAREHREPRISLRPAPIGPAEEALARPRDLVFLHAGLLEDSDGGLLSCLRRGDVIDPEIADELLEALAELEGVLRDSPAIDRKLAYALHRIAFEGQVLVTDSPGEAASDPATTERLHRIQEAVDRVLSGDDIRYYNGS